MGTYSNTSGAAADSGLWLFISRELSLQSIASVCLPTSRTDVLLLSQLLSSAAPSAARDTAAIRMFH
jgi:hypothetical protein